LQNSLIFPMNRGKLPIFPEEAKIPESHSDFRVSPIAKNLKHVKSIRSV